MKTTIDLPDDLVKQVKLHALHEGQKLKDAVSALLRKGLAAAPAGSPTLVHADKAMLLRRRQLTRKFIAGEWSARSPGFEAARAADRQAAARHAKAWRD